MSCVKPVWLLLALAMAPLAVAGDRLPGISRLASFQDAEQSLFALSVAPDPQADFPRPDGYEVVVLFDTSATQTGTVRIEGIEVLEELVATLPAGSSLALMSCDMEAELLSDGLVSGHDAKWKTAIARLQKRIPLGATDLGGAIRAAAKQFSSSNAQRTIVYIGDGIHRTNFLTSDEHRELVNGLVAARVTVSSLAIGPVVDVPTLAAFANHTGGVVLARGAIEESTQAIGRMLGLSTAMPVMWVEKVDAPAGLANYFPSQFPPVRMDRDSVVVGKVDGQLVAGKLVLSGTAAGQDVELAIDVTPEPNHPDMGFLAAVVESASRDGGLTLPALGSDGLRAMSFMLANDAESMVKSGRFALSSGQVESAISIAEEALKLDPNNEAARNLLNAAQKVAAEQNTTVPTSFIAQDDDPFGEPPVGDPFGDPAADAPAVDPFGGPAAAVEPMQDDLVAPPVADVPAPAPFTPPARAMELLPTGQLLAEEEAMRQAAAEALDAEVRSQLREAQELGRRDPTGVKNSLKLLLEELESTVDVDPVLRSQLRTNVASAIERVAVLEAEYMNRVQRAEATRAQANFAERLLNETNRREESLKQLVEQFNFLMEERRYLEASKEIAPEISDMAPDTALAYVTREESSLASNYAIVREAFERREQGFVDAMRGVEVAAVPFDGDPPVVYPPPEVWQALTARRRERYSEFNITGGGNEAERRISAALRQPLAEVEYNGTPLRQVALTLADDLNIPIWINQPELDLLSIDPDTPINLNLPGISLRSALRLMLEPLDLTYIIRNEVLEITTTDSANEEPINKVYPVGDLVLGPQALLMMGGGGGMMGGMGGGMGGMGGGMGGMGGMGGGMGGMGGGMGGMGGGMGGMGGGMGGMGGGMFAVPDDTRKPAPLSTHHNSSDVDVEAWVKQLQAASEEDRPAIEAKIRREVQSYVTLAEAQLEAKNDAAATAQFEKVIALVGGLLSSGYPQPWMYQALSLSMEACKYPAEDIKRVLMSSVDFDGSSDQSLNIARYLAKKGMKQEALQILKDLAVIEPNRHDVFALALPLAQETRDLDAMRWVCIGILSKAWPKEQAEIYAQAERLAATAKVLLAQGGRVVESKSFEEAIKQAQQRDLVVRVNWTGKADLDIRVQEPAGTICSLSSPRTASGGMLINDTSSSSEKASLNGYSEYYVCPQGFAGRYDVLVRKVWGEVAGGKATVEIYTNYGTPEQSVISQEVDLSKKDAVVQVELKNGNRQESVADAQLAIVRKQQIESRHAVLGQIAGGGGSEQNDYEDYYNYRRFLQMNRQNGVLGGNPFGFPRGGAVGYQPVITTLPEGAILPVAAVVSADRRYVRIAPGAQFFGIGEVFTYNTVTGGQGQNTGGTGGFGGGGIGGGGLGGGAGGGGGGIF